MNASVGSVVSDHFDGVAAETEDPAGAKLHELALRFQMWGPATFFDHHRGASHTYVQKKNGRLCRPDFVLIPLAWRAGVVRSWTDPAIHAAHPNQDHIAACLEVRLTVQVRSAPHPIGRRIPASLVADPACREQIRQVLLRAPAVNWQVSSHAHAAIITKHIQDGLLELSKSAPKKPRRHYLREDTWALHHTVASIRRALHQRQHYLRHHLLAAAFTVWRRNQASLEQAFSMNRWVKQMRVLLAVGIWQLEHYTRALRALCRRDRIAYLEELAEQFARGASHEVYDAYHKLLCHSGRSPFDLNPCLGFVMTRAIFVLTQKASADAGGSISVPWRLARTPHRTSLPSLPLLHLRTSAIAGPARQTRALCRLLPVFSVCLPTPKLPKPLALTDFLLNCVNSFLRKSATSFSR